MAEIPPAQWDQLAGDDDPFIEHAFLSLLEDTGAVSEGTGWAPRHLTLWSEDRLVAALPLYEKSHSFGEYIFDWAWADAAHRAGIRYFNKLVSMVPFTPATGRRLLVHPDWDPA
ncbi:MAG: peptidogalycan biosysnthesis protein, partial [Myxococcota bacterium]